MLDIGFQELLVVMVIALLVFGPYKLPELGRALGRAMREFRRASDEFRSTIETNLNINEETILPPSASLPPATSPQDLAAPAGAADTEASGSLETAQGSPAGSGPGTEGGLEEAADWIASGGQPAPPLEPFCAQRGGRLLHRTTCDWVGRIRDAERVAYKAFAEGTEAGLVPCPACEPRHEPGEGPGLS